MEKEPIPQSVINALAIVRESGLINMFDRNGVITLIVGDDDYEAADWLLENKPRYMEALMEMGKQVSIDE